MISPQVLRAQVSKAVCRKSVRQIVSCLGSPINFVELLMART